MQNFCTLHYSVSEGFLCLSISAKTNRLFFTIGGPDGVRCRFAKIEPDNNYFAKIEQFYVWIGICQTFYAFYTHFFILFVKTPCQCVLFLHLSILHHFYHYWFRRRSQSKLCIDPVPFLPRLAPGLVARSAAPTRSEAPAIRE